MSNPTPRPTPGLLYVSAHFTNPTLLTSAFDSWYNNEHIPHLLTMDGVHSAMRYVKTSPSAPDPHLAIYPLKDTAWVHSEEFKTAIDSTESDVLPGRSVFKSVGFDGRCYDLVQSYRNTGAPDGQEDNDAPAAYAVLEAIEPAAGEEGEAELERWNRLQHLDMLSLCDGYTKSKRYRLSEPQKEEWEQKWKTEGERPPTFLAIHEFRGEGDAEKERVRRVGETEWAKKIRNEAGRVEELIYRLTGAFGEERWVS